jgi:hypothetical protein
LGYKATLLWDLDEITFKKEFEKFKNKVTTNDEVIFYFAGHGLEILGANYLLPTDIKFDEVDEIKEHSVLLQNFLESMNERKSKLTLAIIDTSRDNPFKNQGRLVGAPTSPFAGQIVAFSSSIGQSPLDYLGPHDINPNGLFARVFVQEIKIPGQLIEVTLNNVRGKVKNLADSANYLQVPNVNTSLINSYYLNK